MVERSHRYPSLEVVTDYLSGGVDGLVRVDGTREIDLVIRAHGSAIGVRAPADGPPPEVSGYASIEADCLDEQGVMWNQVLFHISGNLPELFPVVCGVIDQMIDDDSALADAVMHSIDALVDIVEGRSGLSMEARVGLFGELLAFLSIVGKADADRAVTAWKGPLKEEHDFGFGDVDVEVKTTTAEQRQHWISTLTQLVPSPGRPLLLLSLQITSGDGLSLPDLVDAVRTVSGHRRAEVDYLLNESGYRDKHADLYVQKYRLRSTPAFYLVSESFPAITPTRLSAVPAADHIVDVRYRLNLAGLVESEAPEAFGSFHAVKGEGNPPHVSQ